MAIISDATTWSVTYDRHSDYSRGVIYYRNIIIIIIQTTGEGSDWQGPYPS
jgi:hypothetical protein